MFDMTNPRESARRAIEQSLPDNLWEDNWNFSQKLVSKIKSNPLYNHPVIKFLNETDLDLKTTLEFHLEFSHAFAEIFTDTVINCMATSDDLEKKLGPEGKVSARFLLQINLLDELGFMPGEGVENQYCGHPCASHYLQFHETLRDLGYKKEQISNYVPSDFAVSCRRSFQDTFKDHLLCTSILAAAEQVFTRFAGPWARNVARSTSIDVTQGYHSIHVEDDDGGFIDDDHSEDSWYLFSQAVTPDRFNEVEMKLDEWLELWNGFGDHIVKLGKKLTQ